ncbi:J domain-containing protein DDB_G0295729-like [Chenopodium quinoa]|uniref:J domain-containing protein DDB_G0295729-like n=1 Tax=Chenopodium quinoa TaxID=63459 RepID=UPI000B798A0A|nr:J domain-containing protein DDB_G0295729-like [Chenopodium quinoa]
MDISNPNPPPTLIIIDISSDEEEEGEFVQVEPEPESPEQMEESNDSNFDPSSYKQSTDKRDNKQKAEEFSNLRMDKMPVTEYYTKFIELSRFAEGSVSTEKAKARKFESGLTTDLQLKLCGQVFEILDEVYGRVAHLYALEEKKKKELVEIEGIEKRKEVGQVSGNQQGNQNGFKKQKYHHNNNFHNNNNFHGNNRQGNRNNNGGARNNNQGNNKNGRVYFCKRCKNNHPRKDCEGNAVTYRFCNKLVHREYECFSKNNNGNRQNSNNSWGNQRNFQQNNNNFAGNKGVQQNGARNSNTTSGNNQQKN